MQSSGDSLRSSTRAAAATLAAKVGAAALAAALLVVLGRSLPKEEVGAFLYAWSWLEVLATVSALGLEPLLVRATALAGGDGARERLLGLVRAADAATTATSALVALTVAMALFALALQPSLRAAVLAALLVLPLRVLVTLRQATLQGAREALWSLVPLPVLQPALLLVGIPLCAAILTRPSAVAAMLVSAVATAIALAAAEHRCRTRVAFARGAGARAYEPARWARAALPMAFISASALLMTRLDSLMLGAYADASAVADLGIASRAAEIARFGLLAAIPVYSAAFASAHAVGDLAALQRDVRQACRVAIGVALAAAAALAIAGPWLLAIVGPEYRAAYPPLLVLLLAEVVRASAGPAQRLLLMTGQEALLATGYAFALALYAALGAALVPSHGALGAAAATATTALVWNAAMVVAVRRRIGVDPAVTCLLARDVAS